MSEGKTNVFTDEDLRQCRNGASWLSQILLLVAFVWAILKLIPIVGDLHFWASHRVEVLLTVGGIACWRWGWFLLQNGRAIIYRFFTFPRLRRQAAQAVAEFGPVPEVTILATTYHEKPWITAVVFESVFGELRQVRGLRRRPKVVVVTGCDEDDQEVQAVYARCCGGPGDAQENLWPPELVLLRGETGKRAALHMGMQEIARGNPHPDGAVVFMDADTLLRPGLLDRVLPMFRLQPNVGGVTTNENGLVKGPAWFAEWISLRFGLRHRTMCSVALSGKLLCLTGRLSVFRASVITDPSFSELVQRDVITHWLWGDFEMMSGDDKTTWYWLAKHQHRMLYVPDAMVTTIEVVQGSAVQRALANIRRWSGNSVRHSWRAIKLGPRRLGLFPWWSLLDQRVAMGTVLVGPTVLLLALCSGRYDLAAGYLLWVLTSRLSHAAIAWRQGRRFSAFYVPLQILSDWATALTKFWVMFHPAQQSWLNRGARKLNAVRGSTFYGLRSGFAHYLYAFSAVLLVAVVGLFVGFLPIFQEARLFLNATAAPARMAGPSENTPLPAHRDLLPAYPYIELAVADGGAVAESLAGPLLMSQNNFPADPTRFWEQLITATPTNDPAYSGREPETGENYLYQQSAASGEATLMPGKAMQPARKDATRAQAKPFKPILHDQSKP